MDAAWYCNTAWGSMIRTAPRDGHQTVAPALPIFRSFNPAVDNPCQRTATDGCRVVLYGAPSWGDTVASGPEAFAGHVANMETG